ncbi:MAG: pyridoxamine 5'-phosphate oxidase family protein [Acidimicrobiia bacterium]
MAEPASVHSRIRRDDRAHYDKATVNAILDAAWMAHVGIVNDAGHPVVIPMLYVRDGDSIVVHGSPATRLLRDLKKGLAVCVTVTIVDGLVLARSAFHHSINYRSVVVMGTATVVDNDAEKEHVLALLTDHVVPGRNATLRPMTVKEIKGTSVLRIPIDEASAKIRTGPPIDDEDDYALPIWAGVIPVSPAYGAPEPDPRNLDGMPLPPDVLALSRKTKEPAAAVRQRAFHESDISIDP